MDTSYFKDYYKKNKQNRLEYQKEYNLENKERIKEYQRQYAEKNKEKKKEYYQKQKLKNMNIKKEKCSLCHKEYTPQYLKVHMALKTCQKKKSKNSNTR